MSGCAGFQGALGTLDTYLYATVPLFFLGALTPSGPTTNAEPKSTSFTSIESESEEWSFSF